MLKLIDFGKVSTNVIAAVSGTIISGLLGLLWVQGTSFVNQFAKISELEKEVRNLSSESKKISKFILVNGNCPVESTLVGTVGITWEIKSGTAPFSEGSEIHMDGVEDGKWRFIHPHLCSYP